MTDYQNPRVLLHFETSRHLIKPDTDEPGIHISSQNSEDTIYIDEDEMYDFLSAYQMALNEAEKVRARLDRKASDDEE